MITDDSLPARFLCPARNWAQLRPAAPALLTAGSATSWRQLDALVNAAAAALAARGVGQGDPVALHLPESRQAVVLLLALWRLGAIACPLNRRQPAAALAAELAAAGCRRLIAATPLETDQAVCWLAGELAADGDCPVALMAEAPATIVFTSGSSGRPRAVLHDLGNHYASALGANQALGFGAADCWLLSLPLYHVAGLGILWRCLLSGAAIAIPAADGSLAQALDCLPANYLSLVPTQLRRLLAEPLPTTIRDRLQVVLIGGAAAPPGLLRQAAAAGLPVVSCYGATETTALVTATKPAQPAEAAASSGEVLPYREVTIAADSEILVRGQTVCRGVLVDGQLQSVRNPQGWYATGDLGTLNAGRLQVFGRRDQMFVSGGENIHPEAIERLLLSLPTVRAAVVVPLADAEFGHRPVAFVDGEMAAETTWRAALASALPRYAVPIAFYPWPEAERGGRAKPDRAALRQLANQQASS